jgi:hypothetical protein
VTPGAGAALADAARYFEQLGRLKLRKRVRDLPCAAPELRDKRVLAIP